jgi:uncharacterized membrane protein YphA (DoxX/SURF4 family)
MFPLSEIIQTILILFFIGYGSSCFFSNHMVLEFKRYKLENWRKFTGLAQLLACLGLIVGFYWPTATTLSALGLTIMMFVAMIVRVRIQDSIISTLPAFIFFTLSLLLTIQSFFYENH